MSNSSSRKFTKMVLVIICIFSLEKEAIEEGSIVSNKGEVDMLNTLKVAHKVLKLGDHVVYIQYYIKPGISRPGVARDVLQTPL